MKTDMYNVMEAYIKRNGLEMSKRLSSASYGFFFSQDATYDHRTACSIGEVTRLTGEGFGISEDMGMWLWNAFKSAEISKPERKRISPRTGLPVRKYNKRNTGRDYKFKK